MSSLQQSIWQKYELETSNIICRKISDVALSQNFGLHVIGMEMKIKE